MFTEPLTRSRWIECNGGMIIRVSLLRLQPALFTLCSTHNLLITTLHWSAFHLLHCPVSILHNAVCIHIVHSVVILITWPVYTVKHNTSIVRKNTLKGDMFRLCKLTIFMLHMNLKAKHRSLRWLVGSICTVRCVNILLKLWFGVINFQWCFRHRKDYFAALVD
jgi:hypothetical protein